MFPLTIWMETQPRFSDHKCDGSSCVIHIWCVMNAFMANERGLHWLLSRSEAESKENMTNSHYPMSIRQRHFVFKLRWLLSSIVDDNKGRRIEDRLTPKPIGCHRCRSLHQTPGILGEKLLLKIEIIVEMLVFKIKVFFLLIWWPSLFWSLIGLLRSLLLLLKQKWTWKWYTIIYSIIIIKINLIYLKALRIFVKKKKT